MAVKSPTIKNETGASKPGETSADASASAAAGGRGEPPRTYMPSKRLQQTQAQVDEVVDIMRVNVEKVLERDQKLSELDNRAEALQVGASRFEQSAGKLKNKFWWQNMKTSAQHFERSAVRLKRKFWWENLKMWLILGGVVLVIIVIIIVWVVTGQKQEQQAVQPVAPVQQPVPMGGDNAPPPDTDGMGGGPIGGPQDYPNAGGDEGGDSGMPDNGQQPSDQ